MSDTPYSIIINDSRNNKPIDKDNPAYVSPEEPRDSGGTQNTQSI